MLVHDAHDGNAWEKKQRAGKSKEAKRSDEGPKGLRPEALCWMPRGGI